MAKGSAAAGSGHGRVTGDVIHTLGELATHIGAELEGDAGHQVRGLGTLAGATGEQVSFFTNTAYSEQLRSSAAGAVVLAREHAPLTVANKLICAEPYLAFARLSALYAEARRAGRPAKIHPRAVVSPRAKLGADVAIGANVVIEDDVVIGNRVSIGAGSIIGAGSRIGSDSRLHGNVTLYHEVSLGARVTVHAGAVLGADGFGFAFDGEKSVKIHQLGGLRIGADVEIGAATTIDRGAIDDTVIEEGVKIDNHVQIGHNCIVGAHTVICGCTALAGSVTVGRNCVLGGGSGVVGHVTVGDGVQLSARALLSQSVSGPGRYSSGTGFMPMSSWKRAIVHFRHLDRIVARLRKLEKSAASGGSEPRDGG